MMSETTPGKTKPQTNPTLAPPVEPNPPPKTGSDLDGIGALANTPLKADPVEPGSEKSNGSDLDASKVVEERAGNS